MEEWLLGQQGGILYLLIFLTLLGGSIGMPFPEDIVLITSGILIHRELVDPYLIFLVAYGTIILGDVILYYIGYFFGMNLFVKRWFRNKVPPKKIKKIRAHLESNHIVTIFLGRHLFYLRSMTFLTCGAVRMKFAKYILADIFAALLSCTIMMLIGYFASENYDQIKQHLASTQIAILILLASGLSWWYIKRRNRLRKNTN